MTSLWLLCLAGIGVIEGSVLPQDRANSTCQPGTVWLADDGCNTCFCLENGLAGCSLMDCSSKNSGDTGVDGGLDGESGMKPLPLPEPVEEIAPFDTNMGAQKPKQLPIRKPDNEEAIPYNVDWDDKQSEKPVEERTGVSCAPGEEWQEDCNTCFCLGKGKAACTKMGCSSDSRALGEGVKDHCDAGTTWSDDCNVCHCVGDNQVICSYRTCAGPESRRRRRQASCTPGERHQVDCNECVCLPNCAEACTFKFCLPEDSQQSRGFSDSARSDSGAECVLECPADCGSRRNEDGCLTCECDNSRFFGEWPPPSQPASAASSDRSWDQPPMDPDSAPEPLPYGSWWPRGHTDDSRMQRHSSFGGEENGASHYHSVWGDIIADSDRDASSKDFFADGAERDSTRHDGVGRDRFTSQGSSEFSRFTPSRDSSADGFTSIRGFGGDDSARFGSHPGGSSAGHFSSSVRGDSSRYTPHGRYDSSANRYSSSGDVTGNTIRFVDRPRFSGGGAGAGTFSNRRGEDNRRWGEEDSRSGGSVTPGRQRDQSSWEAFSDWSTSQGQRAKSADSDGWTSLAGK